MEDRSKEAWAAHPDNEAPSKVADRLERSIEWANEHVGPHRCVDGRRYIYSCLVSDPSMDGVARSYMSDWAARELSEVAK